MPCLLLTYPQALDPHALIPARLSSSFPLLQEFSPYTAVRITDNGIVKQHPKDPVPSSKQVVCHFSNHQLLPKSPYHLASLSAFPSVYTVAPLQALQTLRRLQILRSLFQSSPWSFEVSATLSESCGSVYEIRSKANPWFSQPGLFFFQVGFDPSLGGANTLCTLETQPSVGVLLWRGLAILSFQRPGSVAL